MSSKPRLWANLYHAAPNPLVNLCIAERNVHLNTSKIPVISQSQTLLFHVVWYGILVCRAVPKEEPQLKTYPEKDAF